MIPGRGHWACPIPSGCGSPNYESAMKIQLSSSGASGVNRFIVWISASLFALPAAMRWRASSRTWRRSRSTAMTLALDFCSLPYLRSL